MKRKKLQVSFVFAVLFLAFLIIMDYPFLARMVNERNQAEIAVAYEEKIATKDETEKEQLLDEARLYNDSLASGTGKALEDMLGEEMSGNKGDKEYESLLNINEDGIMGRIEIPKIDVDLLIYHGTSEEVLQKGAGHLQGSSLPVGGESTHTCISAHRGLVGKEMFTNLDQIEKGDLFFIHVLGETLCYRVNKISVVLPDEVKDLEIKRGKDLATLITCTPYGINSHRLYVQGYRVPYTEEIKEEAQEAITDVQNRWINWWWAVVSIVLLIVMIILIWRYNLSSKN